ncbi:MAG: hypothetical protein WAU57_07970 [Xanthobacteraceae bacterium]
MIDVIASKAKQSRTKSLDCFVASLLAMTRLALLIKPFFIAERLLQLAKRGFDVARLSRFCAFFQERPCECPAWQPCEIGVDVAIDERKRLFDRRDLARLSRGANANNGW